jgi:hypothetical protein
VAAAAALPTDKGLDQLELTLLALISNIKYWGSFVSLFLTNRLCRLFRGNSPRFPSRSVPESYSSSEREGWVCRTEAGTDLPRQVTDAWREKSDGRQAMVTPVGKC